MNQAPGHAESNQTILALAAAARIVGCPVDTAQPAELLTAGEPAGATPALGLTGKSVVRLPEDLRLAEAGAFAGVTAAAAAAAADTRYKSEEATPISATLLPDLCFGTGGMTSLFTPRQEFRNRYMAAILNRLAANRLHAGRGAAFAVVVGEASVTSAGELMGQYMERMREKMTQPPEEAAVGGQLEAAETAKARVQTLVGRVNRWVYRPPVACCSASLR